MQMSGEQRQQKDTPLDDIFLVTIGTEFKKKQRRDTLFIILGVSYLTPLPFLTIGKHVFFNQGLSISREWIFCRKAGLSMYTVLNVLNLQYGRIFPLFKTFLLGDKYIFHDFIIARHDMYT